MSEHAIYKVMRAEPINSAARKAVRQGNCSYDETELNRSEMIEILDRLQRKIRLLKLVLGVKTNAQAHNLRGTLKGKPYASGKSRARSNPRAAFEFHRCGQEIQRMNRCIQDLKAAKKGIVPVKHGWKSL